LREDGGGIVLELRKGTTQKPVNGDIKKDSLLVREVLGMSDEIKNPYHHRRISKLRGLPLVTIVGRG